MIVTGGLGARAICCVDVLPRPICESTRTPSPIKTITPIAARIQYWVFVLNGLTGIYSIVFLPALFCRAQSIHAIDNTLIAQTPHHLVGKT
jgi:hypothetical protein